MGEDYLSKKYKGRGVKEKRYEITFRDRKTEEQNQMQS